MNALNSTAPAAPLVSQPGPRYDSLTIRLHWATAALVLLLWGSAQLIDLFPKGAPRWNMRSVHMLLGLALGAVVAWRIYWRATAGRRLPPAGAPGTYRASRALHGLLYALLVGVVGLGIVNAWVRGDHVFQLFEIPSLAPGDKVLRHDIGALHEYGAYAILTFAGLHALAALFHHYLLRDGLLHRMLAPRRP